MFIQIFMKQLLLVFLLIFSVQKTSFSDPQKSAILVQNPGSFQLASDHQELVNFNLLVKDCFSHSNQVKTNNIDSHKVMKIISHWVQSSEYKPVIHCRDLIAAYVSETETLQ